MPQIDLATLAIKADTTDLTKLDKALDLVDKRGRTTEKTTGSLAGSFGKLGAAVGGVITVGAASAAVVKTVDIFRDLEKRLVGVQKTTDFTGAEMDTFGKRIDEISRRVPIATASLVDIAGVAGQLGIKGVDNVTQFTETVGKLSLATDIVGEEGAASIARLLNVTGEGIGTVDKFGAVLVALGNNSAATESEILKLATEVGLATSTFAVTSAETLAMGAAMKSLGVSAELGGSVVGRAMREIEASINEGGESMEHLSRVTGIATEDLKEQFGANATVVFQKWVEGIGEMIDGGMSAADALDTFNLRGEEVLKVLPTMAVNSEQLGKSLGIANEELERGTALNNEVAKASATLDSQLIIAQNIATDYAAEIGENLAPKIKDIIVDFQAWDEATGDLVKRDIAEWIGSGLDAAVTFGKAITSIDEVIGIAFADWQISWENFVFGWEKGTLTLSSSFGIAFDQIKIIAADGLENIAGNMSTLPLIGDDIAAEFKGASENIRSSATASAEYETALANLKGAHEANVRALEFYKLKQAETIEITFASTEATEKEAETSTETTETVINNEQRVVDAKEEARNAIEQQREQDLIGAQELTDQQLELQEFLTEETMRVKEDEFWFKTAMLEKEAEALIEKAEGDQELIDQVHEYHELKQNQLYENFVKREEAKKKKLLDTAEASKKIIGSVVEAFVAGEDVKVAVARAAQDILIEYATNAATRGLTEILEALGQEIGGWIGLGTAQSSTEGDNWATKIASGAGYLAAAGAAVLAGKAVGNNFADGGWVGNHPNGGVINSGSGFKDDVFLGYTNGGNTLNYGMRDEFVVNREATAANIDALHFINEQGRNKRLFDSGGLLGSDGGPPKPPFWPPGEPWPPELPGVGDIGGIFGGGRKPKDWSDREGPGISTKGAVNEGAIWSTTEDINNSGFATFVETLLSSGFNWYKAAAESILYYGGVGIGSIAGKEMGQNLFANGGPMGVRGYADGGILGDVVGTILDVFGWDFGDIWDYLRGFDFIGDFVKLADTAIFPFVRDVATPGASPGFGSIEEGIKNSFDDLLDLTVDALKDLIEDVVDPFDLFACGGVLGSYAAGTNFVPATGLYELHRGEAVTPAADNMMIGGNNRLLQEISDKLQQIIDNTNDASEVLSKFDLDGLPQERDY